MSELGFENWFLPLSFEEFRKSVLGREPLALLPNAPFAERVQRAFGVHSFDDVLSLRVQSVHAWFHRLNGSHTAARIPLSSAKDFYDGGTTIYVQDAPEFDVHEAEIAASLGLPAFSVKCTLFCNRPSARTAAHFDPVDVISVQLQGRKQWRLAPNAFAPSPLRNWGVLDAVPPELRLYAKDPAPTSMPADVQVVKMEPGSILHVPRGYWHETSSNCDSISMHVQIAPPVLANVVMAALRNELCKDEYWRSSVYELAGAPHGAEAAAIMREACRALAATVARLDPTDILRGPVESSEIEEGTHFRRCGQVSLCKEKAAEDGMRVAVIAHGPKNKITQLEMTDIFLEAVEWIDHLETGCVFTVRELTSGVDDLDATSAVGLLRELENAYMVQRTPSIFSRDQ